MVKEGNAAGNFAAALAIKDQVKRNVGFGGGSAQGSAARAREIGGHNRVARGRMNVLLVTKSRILPDTAPAISHFIVGNEKTFFPARFLLTVNR
jgi:hypothetical protein